MDISNLVNWDIIVYSLDPLKVDSGLGMHPLVPQRYYANGRHHAILAGVAVRHLIVRRFGFLVTLERNSMVRFYHARFGNTPISVRRNNSILSLVTLDL
jgi:hypothetical protein